MSWRPRNETQGDLDRELAAARKIEQRFGVEHIKLSESLYHVDWAFFRDGILAAWGEYKYRQKRYDTLYISLAKFAQMFDLSRITAVPAYLFVEWPDGLYRVTISDMAGREITLNGNNRGQNGDKEPVIHIPAAEFTRIA